MLYKVVYICCLFLPPAKVNELPVQFLTVPITETIYKQFVSLMSHVNRLFSLNLSSWHVIKGKIDDWATIMYTHCFNIYAQNTGLIWFKKIIYYRSHPG